MSVIIVEIVESVEFVQFVDPAIVEYAINDFLWIGNNDSWPWSRAQQTQFRTPWRRLNRAMWHLVGYYQDCPLCA